MSTPAYATLLPFTAVYTHDYDTNGVFYLLGTMPPAPQNVNPGEWFNPAMAGRVLVSAPTLLPLLMQSRGGQGVTGL